MKNLFLLAVVFTAIVIASCSHSSPAPAPATASPTPTSSMTATEAALVGDWIWDKTEYYQNGNLVNTYTGAAVTNTNGTVTTSTVYAGSHMVLKSTFYNGTVTTPQQYNADHYSSLSASSAWWVMTYGNDDRLCLSSAQYNVFGVQGGYIVTLNANTLIYQPQPPGQIANGNKCYFHK